MRLSLKLRDETNQGPLLRAKVPVTILGMPFLSAVAAGESSDLLFSLRTNFTSGPSLSVSYRPAPSGNPNPTSGVNPFSVSLKSGIGIFGSSQNSPLVFTANFNLNNSNTTVVPSFSLLVKPQFGNFSLRKSTSSATATINQVGKTDLNGNLLNGSGSESDLGNSFCLEKPLQWRDLKKGEGYAEINGLLSGILVAAKTSLPVTKSSVVNFRWGVSFPSDGSKMISRPVLMLNKIELERIDEIKKDEEVKKKNNNADSSKPDDLDVLKGMCGWMRSELQDLQKQNREMRQTLEGSKMQLPVIRTRGEDKKGVSIPSEKSSDFAKWRSKKNGVGEDDRQRDWNQANAGGSRMSEIESELQKALKANGSSSS